jgi:hypothetical protein
MTMKAARFRLAYAMVIVLIAALDLALIRTSRLVGGGRLEDLRLQLIVLIVLPMANLLAFALFLLTRRSGPGRRFWGGFVTSTALSSALIIAWATLADLSSLEASLQTFGRSVATSLFGASNILNTTKILLLCAIFATAFTLPQLLLAVVVGYLTRVLGKGREQPSDLRVRPGPDG